MNPKKTGTVFIVLLITLVAYGCGSFAYAVGLGGDIGVGILPSNFSFNNQQQITQINDPSFEPVILIKRIAVNTTNTTANTTNTTTTTTTTTTNSSNRSFTR
jgi:hypothetical protein